MHCIKHASLSRHNQIYLPYSYKFGMIIIPNICIRINFIITFYFKAGLVNHLMCKMCRLGKSKTSWHKSTPASSEVSLPSRRPAETASAGVMTPHHRGHEPGVIQYGGSDSSSVCSTSMFDADSIRSRSHSDSGRDVNKFMDLFPNDNTVMNTAARSPNIQVS